MKKALEAILIIMGAVIFVAALLRVDFWGIVLGAGLVVAPLTASGMLLMYIALIGIPLGCGIILLLIARPIFDNVFISGSAFIVGLILGGKFVVSDSFDRIFTKAKPDNSSQ